MVTLFASTPCYGGMCLQAYAESMLRLQRACAANGFQMMLDTTENESLVHRARNLAVARFYQKTQADRKSTRLNSSHSQQSRMPSSA